MGELAPKDTVVSTVAHGVALHGGRTRRGKGRALPPAGTDIENSSMGVLGELRRLST